MFTALWRRVTDALFTPERAEAAALRQWLAQDAEHATLAVCHGRYGVKDGLHFLITAALALAERTKIAPELAHKAAVGLFNDRLQYHEERLRQLRWDAVDAARRSFAKLPGDRRAAARAAAEVARAGQAPYGFVRFAVHQAGRAAP